MKVSVLVTGDYLFTGDELLKQGYVYIENGIIKALGAGLPPSEYTYANLVLGGPDRIVMPALAAAVSPLMYPFRLLRKELRPSECELSRLQSKNQFKLSLPLVYEAHMSGISTLLVVGPSLELPLTLRENIGGFYGFAPFKECGIMPGSRDVGGVLGIVESLPENAILEYPRRDLSMIEDPLEYSRNILNLLEINNVELAEGARASIAVYNLRSPPIYGLVSEDAVRALYRLGGGVESLIAGEDVLVDAGEHLWIVERHLKDALSISRSLVSI